MHNAAFRALGLPHRYLAFHVPPAALEQAIRGAAALGFGGLNLTVPHKQAVLAHCDELSECARAIGAVNTIRFVEGRVHGHNTDAGGFIDALAELPGPAPKRATVLGAGGASLAIVHALVTTFEDLELTWVSRRHPESPLATSPHVRTITWDDLGASEGDLLINTTIVGLAGGPEQFPIPLVFDELEPGARVIDIVYPRPVGGLLDRAAAAGLTVQDGLPMLLWQGVRALESWLGHGLEGRVIEQMRGALHSG
jgi:shikimate dehydrogenase